MDLPFAGVVVGGAARTALVLVLAAIDAGREGVLSEVVAVRRRSGGAISPPYCRYVRDECSGDGDRELRQRAPLRGRRTDLPH